MFQDFFNLICENPLPFAAFGLFALVKVFTKRNKNAGYDHTISTLPGEYKTEAQAVLGASKAMQKYQDQTAGGNTHEFDGTKVNSIVTKSGNMVSIFPRKKD